MHTDPLFACQLSPHRAMDRRGIQGVIVFTAALAAIPGITFFAMGAWPVVGLLGLDILVLYWALSRSLKDGDAFEVITLWRDHLDIRCVSPKGRETVHSFNTFRARLVIERDGEARITRVRIEHRVEGAVRGIEIGRFLNADDKARFVTLFAPELARAKG